MDTSLEAKFDAASLRVNVINNESLLVTAPSLTAFPLLFLADIVTVGAMVSMMKFFIDDKDPDCPGVGKIKFALFPAGSFIVPLFKINAF